VGDGLALRFIEVGKQLLAHPGFSIRAPFPRDNLLLIPLPRDESGQHKLVPSATRLVVRAVVEWSRPAIVVESRFSPPAPNRSARGCRECKSDPGRPELEWANLVRLSSHKDLALYNLVGWLAADHRSPGKYLSTVGTPRVAIRVVFDDSVPVTLDEMAWPCLVVFV